MVTLATPVALDFDGQHAREKNFHQSNCKEIWCLFFKLKARAVSALLVWEVCKIRVSQTKRTDFEPRYHKPSF
jgi:hypothetical protein